MKGMDDGDDIDWDWNDCPTGQNVGSTVLWW